MRRIPLLVAMLLAALVTSATAWAGATNYLVSSYWSPGQGGSSAFSSSWFQNIMIKNAGFDSTITFIDNVSYGWHATTRGYATYLETHWLSSQVKKAHCRANVAASTWAACTVYS